MRLFNSYVPCLDAWGLIACDALSLQRSADRVETGLPGRAEIHCPICGNRLRLPAGESPRDGRCRACGVVFPIPGLPAISR